MFNYFNLDSSEFEELCSEVLSKYLKKEFRTYAEGKDQGIDIRSVSGENSIIGQAKRYKSVSGVFEDELPKLKKVGCKKYYLFVACQLTPQKHTEIREYFKEFMESEENIFDGKKLNFLLDTAEYKDILKKHFKLWASSSTILDLLIKNKLTIDTEVLVEQIKKHSSYYVETDDFKNISNTFFKERMVLIKGDPGVGKTTISEMLVLKMLNEFPETHFVYSSTGNAEDIKDSLSGNSEDKELIYLDDFLGDIYLSLKREEVDGICSLISYVKNNPNKYLILNTRVVVMNAASSNYFSFKSSINDIGIKEITIDHLNKYDKGKILYNHIYFSDIPFEKKKEFLEKKYYLKIVDHENYNPRSIETLCSNKNYELSGKDDYIEFCNSVLEEQEFTWLHSFENNLGETDRAFLLVLYSLINKYHSIGEKLLEKSYEHEIANGYNGIDQTLNNFKTSLKRLNDCFITISIVDSSRIISFSNPSVKECIGSCYKGLKNEPFYIEQQLFENQNLLKTDKIFSYFKNHEISKINFCRWQPSLFCGVFFAINNTIDFDIDYEPEFLESFNFNYKYNVSTEFGLTHHSIFKQLIMSSLFGKVDLNKIPDEYITSFAISCLSILSLEHCKEIFERFDKEKLGFALDDDEIKDFFIDDEINNLDVNEIIENNTNYYEDFPPEFDSENARSEALDTIENNIDDNETYSYLRDNFNFFISCSDINDSFDGSDISSKLSSRYEREPDDFDYYKESLYFSKDEDTRLDELFSNLLDKE